MDNLYLDYLHITNHTLKNIQKLHYQSATNFLVILHSPHVSIYTFNNKNNIFQHHITHGPIDQVQNQNILLIEWLLEEQCILCIGKDGSIFTIDKNGSVDIKAQNQDGINGATVSPTQEYIYVVTNNKSLIQLNKEFDLVNQILLDENQQVRPTSSQFSWRADGNFFTLNYQTINGHKSVTKDIMMATFISPAKSDPNEDGLVQSVSQKGRKRMLNLVCWQPSGGIIAGVDYIVKEEMKEYRIIFWQKNGLRHLEFNLPQNTIDVLQLFWSLDSSILFVKIQQQNKKQKLLAYYRSNYHWFLKTLITINTNDICRPLSSEKSKRHKLLIVSSQKFQVIQYSIRNSQKQWKSEIKQRESKYQYVYFIDGNVVNITDLSKCLMPPPMSMNKLKLDKKIVGSSKRQNYLLIITENEINLINLITNQTVKNYILKPQDNISRVYNINLISSQPTIFTIGSNIYQLINQKLIRSDEYKGEQNVYTIQERQQIIKVVVKYQNQELQINQNVITSQCTSFIFYHEFLIFTVATSNMYDKLFVINLHLDQWIHSQNPKFKEKLSDFETKDLLNHRLVQRGSKIIGISEGRVVFQLPRGNLEGIYPKIIMINQVKKKIALKDYRAAYEIIRTHKLDFNLLYDIDYEQFVKQIILVLNSIKRVDYINLFVSQLAQNLSGQLQYAFSSKQLSQIQEHFNINYQGKKVKAICRLISETLRELNKDQYILSIFTSQIKEGKLNEVLFEIKQLKKNDVEVITAPHISQNNQQKKNKKKISAQQILEYVCWLVDANAIYQASLLTYDLQLAAMTARWTQKDPKQYIPYLQSLKNIENTIEFRKKICLDLKRYEIAVKQLANGNIEQRNESLDLIKKHKLFKHGVLVYTGKQQLRKVKEIIIQQLEANGEINQAYRVCQSIGQHKKALDIAIKAMDTKKIKESIEIVFTNRQEQIKQAKLIIDKIKENIKNRKDLARLLAFVQNYEEAVSIYLKHNQYRKAYKYLWKVSEQFRKKEMIEGFQLCFSIKRNEILRDKKEFLEKYSRLIKVHKHKAQYGEVTSFKPRQNDDMYSEVSVSSKAQSNYTISTTTGMRKKKDKKRSILSRNVKEGSLLQQQYLIAYIKNLEQKVQETVKDSKLLIQHLICLDLIQQGEILRNEVRQYISTFNLYKIKSYAKIKFQQLHPAASELYYEESKLSNLSIDSFNYLF